MGTNWTAGQHKGPLDETITRALRTYLLRCINQEWLDSSDEETAWLYSIEMRLVFSVAGLSRFTGDSPGECDIIKPAIVKHNRKSGSKQSALFTLNSAPFTKTWFD